MGRDAEPQCAQQFDAEATGWCFKSEKKDLESAGVREGDVIEVGVIRRLETASLQLDRMPTFEDNDPRTSVRHDRYLAA